VRWPIALRSKGKRLARLSGCQNFTAEIEELRSRFALGDILLALVIMTWGQRR
jgi:exosome complex RNA-binding protein Csl4